ncbi:hypothetical protein FTW19_02330 [Terriglobus albidus]|uniref:Uncharacterized protein n=1 Tax=Terriglobus albidus TaxID=1592106 RepID=A0A5B9E3V7_9BACT|nr:hypothetical protein [Terriglobus albidus]QEE26942.1 hypothetical protein FTW19_02330 [Terriglobus albidus]
MRFPFRVLAVGLFAVLPAALAEQAGEAVQQISDQARQAIAIYGPAKPYLDLPVKKLQHQIDDLDGLKIDEDQTQLDALLQHVSETVSAQMPRIPNLAAHEDIALEEERIQVQGGGGGGGRGRGPVVSVASPEMVLRAERRYEFVIRRRPSGNIQIFEESRKELGTSKDPIMPPQATGFSGLWMLFVPGVVEEQRFRYLGTQKVHGRQTAVVAFTQVPERVKVPGVIRGMDGDVPMLQQGLVWVDEQTSRILRIRTDLLTPLPQINTTRLTSTVEYTEVHLPGLDEKLWLPRRVELLWTMNSRNGGEIHRYSNYRLYKANVRIITDTTGNPSVDDAP